MTERGFGDEECDSISPHVSSSSPLQYSRDREQRCTRPERERGHSVLGRPGGGRQISKFSSIKPLCRRLHPLSCSFGFFGSKTSLAFEVALCEVDIPVSETYPNFLLAVALGVEGTVQCPGRRELLRQCYLRARSLLWGVVKRNEECWLQRPPSRTPGGGRGGEGRRSTEVQAATHSVTNLNSGPTPVAAAVGHGDEIKLLEARYLKYGGAARPKDGMPGCAIGVTWLSLSHLF